MLPLVKRSDPWLVFKYLSKGLTHEAAVPVQTGVTGGWGASRAGQQWRAERVHTGLQGELRVPTASPER